MSRVANVKVLTLDIGNTTVDACYFDGANLNYVGKFTHNEIQSLKGNWDLVFVSSVKPSINNKVREIFPQAKLINYKEVNIATRGMQKSKVGIDRLLNLYGALNFYATDAVLLLCGTALVVDILIDGVFLGGFITLGLSNKLRCLHEKAELIPYFELQNLNVAFGKDTKSAVVGGVIKEAKAFVEKVKSDVEKDTKKTLSLIVTGGDGWVFEDMGIYDKLLIHKAILHLKGFIT